MGDNVSIAKCAKNMLTLVLVNSLCSHNRPKHETLNLEITSSGHVSIQEPNTFIRS